MKKLIVLALVLVMVFALAVPAMAVSNNGNNGNNGNSGGNGNGNTGTGAAQTIYLKGSGNSFNYEGWQNIFYVGEIEEGTVPSVWHLVYSGGMFSAVDRMELEFNKGTFSWVKADGPSINPSASSNGNNNNGNNMGWIIVAPYDWKLNYVDKGNNNQSGCFIVTNETGNPQFNISGFSEGWKWPVLNIEKEWIDKKGNVISDINEFLKNFGYDGDDVVVTFTGSDGNAYTVGSHRFYEKLVQFTLTEDTIENIVIETAYGKYIVTFKLVAINGDQQLTEANIDIKINESQRVVFLNSVNVKFIPAIQKVIVKKIWKDEGGNVITDPVRIAKYNSHLAFTDYGLGKFRVKAGTHIAFEEELNDWSEDGFYYYYELESITINGELVGEVDFAVEKGVDYKIIFANILHKEQIGSGDGKIPSKEHADKWWDKYGILCYAANTGNNPNYAIYFREGFWDFYKSVTIGFGVKKDYETRTMTITRVEVLEDPDNPDSVIGYTFDIKLVNITSKKSDPFFEDRKIEYIQRHHSSTGNWPFEVDSGLEFSNVYNDHGSMQAWLISAVSK
jgi:hypothetical protein